MFRLEFRWKDEVISREGDRGCIVQAGWRVSPGVTDVPDAASWDAHENGFARPSSA